LSATGSSDRDSAGARSLHRDLRALFDSDDLDESGAQPLDEVRRLCAALANDDRTCRDALRAVEGCAAFYFWFEAHDRRSHARRSRLRALILRLLETLHRRLLEIESLRRGLDAPQEDSCEVAGRRIPIVMQDRNGRAAQRTLRGFNGGEQGVHETGTYSFWSVLAGPIALFIFRAPHGSSIEERLREYAGKTARRAELLQKFGDRLMPSSEDEVDLWLRAHPADAQFAVSGRCPE
jgi:hypothetical protein